MSSPWVPAGGILGTEPAKSWQILAGTGAIIVGIAAVLVWTALVRYPEWQAAEAGGGITILVVAFTGWLAYRNEKRQGH
jgi:hypothetical protein